MPTPRRQVEIRTEPRPVLILFTAVIVLSLILPLVGLIAVRFAKRRPEFSAIGVVLIVFLGGAFSVVLWKIISSRTNRRRLAHTRERHIL